MGYSPSGRKESDATEVTEHACMHARPVDQKMITTDDRVCHSQFSRGGGMTCHGGPHGGGGGRGRTYGQEPALWFPWKEHMSQTGSRLTGVSNFNRLWGIESSLVVWYLTLGWLG